MEFDTALFWANEPNPAKCALPQVNLTSECSRVADGTGIVQGGVGGGAWASSLLEALLLPYPCPLRLALQCHTYHRTNAEIVRPYSVYFCRHIWKKRCPAYVHERCGGRRHQRSLLEAVCLGC